VVVFVAGRRENVVVADTLIFPNHQVSVRNTFNGGEVADILGRLALEQCTAKHRNILHLGSCEEARNRISRTTTESMSPIFVRFIETTIFIHSIALLPRITFNCTLNGNKKEITIVDLHPSLTLPISAIIGLRFRAGPLCIKLMECFTDPQPITNTKMVV
jgi:hypothetical protein